MKKIDNPLIIEKYYNHLEMSKIFDKDIKNYLQLIEFEPNEYISRDGEDLAYFLFLVKGKAKVFKTLPNGKSLLLSFYTSLRVIGDMEIVRSQQATATLQSLSTCYCLAIPMDIARKELTEDSKFLTFTCESLAEKLNAVSVNSSINLLYPLENRLSSYINESLNYSSNEKDNSYINFGENLVNLAELLGSSYRHLLRTLKSLCEKKVLEKQDKGYKVINKSLLEELAGDLYSDVKFM